MLHTAVKDRIGKRLGRRWTQPQLARLAGLSRQQVSMELCCTGDKECGARHTPQVQDAMAKAVGMSTAQLFGKHAWFRLAARDLKRRRRSA